MECINCPYYTKGLASNYCGVEYEENFYVLDDCDLVDDDGNIKPQEVENEPR